MIPLLIFFEALLVDSLWHMFVLAFCVASFTEFKLGFKKSAGFEMAVKSSLILSARAITKLVKTGLGDWGDRTFAHFLCFAKIFIIIIIYVSNTYILFITYNFFY